MKSESNTEHVMSIHVNDQLLDSVFGENHLNVQYKCYWMSNKRIYMCLQTNRGANYFVYFIPAAMSPIILTFAEFSALPK